MHICRTGKIPLELRPFFDSCRDGNVYQPLVARWQLNMPAETAKNINARALKRLINANPGKQFIVQYNDNTKDAVDKMYRIRARFAVLFDASGGRGIAPLYWRAPVFSRCAQGYSGGLSLENIVENLDRISRVAVEARPCYDKNNQVVIHMEPRDDIWVDAEGKLKTDNLFDINRARQYVLNAESWWAKQRQK